MPLAEFIALLMRKEPDDRFQSAQEVTGRLRQLRADLQRPEGNPGTGVLPGRAPPPYCRSCRSDWAGPSRMGCGAVEGGGSPSSSVAQSLIAVGVVLLRSLTDHDLRAPHRTPEATMGILEGVFLVCAAASLGEGPAPAKTSPELLWRSAALTEEPGPANAVAFSPDGRLLAAAVARRFVLWQAEDGTRPCVIREPDTPLATSVAFSPDGAVLATGRAKSRDHTGRLWRVADGQLLRAFTADRLDVTTVAFAPAGDVLATSGYGVSVRLWTTPDATPLRIVGRDVHVRFSLAFSPDGRALAAAAVRPDAVRVWRVGDGEPLLTLDGHTDFVNDVAYSPDGRLLASASADGTIQVHRADDGERLRTLGERSRPRDHSRSVRAVAFSPDGRSLLAGGVVPGDGARSQPTGVVRLWRVEDGRLMRDYRDETGPGVNDVAVAPNGGSFAYAREDGIVVVARLTPDGAATSP